MKYTDSHNERRGVERPVSRLYSGIHLGLRKQRNNLCRIEVLTAVRTKMAVFRVVAPCSLVGDPARDRQNPEGFPEAQG
jgi:hypothetical protein